MLIINTSWITLKAEIDLGRSFRHFTEHNNYRIFVFLDNMAIEALIPKVLPESAEQVDFEDNYKNLTKKTVVQETISQLEKDNITLKLAHGAASVDVNGEAVVEIKCPGTFVGVTSDKPGRFIDWGKAWFSTQHEGDCVTNIEVVDKDNLLGYGAGTVVRTYHDSDMLADNIGWHIPKHEGTIQVDALGGYGFIPAGMYLRVKGKKGEGQITGSLHINVKWGKLE